MNTKFEQWSAHARTPETRTRIRRLAVLERIFHVLDPEGGHIRRLTSVPTKPRRGDRIRFRHNTRKPDDLHDILYIGFEENDP
jgi:hypothetical protein